MKADYSRLNDYLLRAKWQQLEISFQRIEQIIGASLPVTANRRFGWSNTNNVKYPHISSWVDARIYG